MFWKNQSTTIVNPNGMNKIKVAMDTPKEQSKSITQQLQEYQTKTIQDKQIARNKKEDNQRRFTETIKPMLDELVNFDNHFNYEIIDNKQANVWRGNKEIIYGSWLNYLFFYPNEFYIINAASTDWMIKSSPNSEASESDRFVFYIKTFFGHYLV